MRLFLIRLTIMTKISAKIEPIKTICIVSISAKSSFVTVEIEAHSNIDIAAHKYSVLIFFIFKVSVYCLAKHKKALI